MEIFLFSFLYLKILEIFTGTVNLAPTKIACVEISNCRSESPSYFVWSKLGQIIFPGQAPNDLADECIGFNVGDLCFQKVLTESEKNSTNDDSGQDSLLFFVLQRNSVK
jgi:hypothetical protein